MTKEQLLLIRLMEECNEASQRVSKVLNFGWDEIQEGHTKTNRKRLCDELNDIMGVVRMIDELGVEGPWDNAAQVDKMNRVEKYLEYSRSLGLLTE